MPTQQSRPSRRNALGDAIQRAQTAQAQQAQRPARSVSPQVRENIRGAAGMIPVAGRFVGQAPAEATQAPAGRIAGSRKSLGNVGASIAADGAVRARRRQRLANQLQGDAARSGRGRLSQRELDAALSEMRY